MEAELSELKRRTNPYVLSPCFFFFFLLNGFLRYTREQLIEEKTKIVQRLQQLMKQRTLAAKGRRGAGKLTRKKKISDTMPKVIQTKTDEEIVECLREIRRLGVFPQFSFPHHFLCPSLTSKKYDVI